MGLTIIGFVSFIASGIFYIYKRQTYKSAEKCINQLDHGEQVGFDIERARQEERLKVGGQMVSRLDKARSQKKGATVVLVNGIPKPRQINYSRTVIASKRRF